jgi:hypothetical protein
MLHGNYIKDCSSDQIVCVNVTSWRYIIDSSYHIIVCVNVTVCQKLEEILSSQIVHTC